MPSSTLFYPMLVEHLLISDPLYPKKLTPPFYCPAYTTDLSRNIPLNIITNRKAFLCFFVVGYGTQTPSSITGKAIGGFCAIVGVFILTLPVPIVVNSFASYYKNRLWRNEVSIGCICSKSRNQMQFE